jgi:hypothetical protein
MKRPAIVVAALVLLACFLISACAQENPLAKAVTALFQDQQQVKHVSYAAWRMAKDDGPEVAMRKSFAYLQKVNATGDEIPAAAAPDAFAAWWYNIAAQYWCEIAARNPGGESYVKAAQGIRKARWDLERGLGWDVDRAKQAHQDAYRLMDGYK